MPRSRSPRPPEPGAPQEGELALLQELRALYAEVDARHADHACPSTTECCRFGVTGREPWVTSVELALVERAARSRPAPKRGLPLAPEAPDERPCPLLHAGRCRVYEARPLGCRTFWCERAERPSRVRHAEVLEWVRRVKEIAARHRPRGDEGRPLSRAFAPRRG